MRMLTGALLILAAEQSFAHSYLIGFPHQAFASQLLMPASIVLAALGLAFLVWGLVQDVRG